MFAFNPDFRGPDMSPPDDYYQPGAVDHGLWAFYSTSTVNDGLSSEWSVFFDACRYCYVDHAPIQYEVVLICRDEESREEGEIECGDAEGLASLRQLPERWYKAGIAAGYEIEESLEEVLAKWNSHIDELSRFCWEPRPPVAEGEIEF